MKAQENTTYAIIDNNQVCQLFTKESLPEWNEQTIHTIALSDEQKQWVEVGMSYDETTGQIIKPSLDEYKQAQLEFINANFNKECESIKGDYVPSDEQFSWSMQEAEAKAYKESKNIADAPMLNTLANARGIALDTLVEKVLEKNALYNQKIAILIGHRQALQDSIEKATDIESVKKIEYISPFAE